MSTKFNFEKDALAVIKKRGYRITNTRILVIRALTSAVKPLSAYDVHEIVVSQGNRIDPVSIYRILDFLYELDLVFKVGVESGYFPRKVALEKDVDTFLFIDDNSKDAHELVLPPNVVELIRKSVAGKGFEMGHFALETTGVKAS